MPLEFTPEEQALFADTFPRDKRTHLTNNAVMAKIGGAHNFVARKFVPIALAFGVACGVAELTGKYQEPTIFGAITVCLIGGTRRKWFGYHSQPPLDAEYWDRRLNRALSRLEENPHAPAEKKNRLETDAEKAREHSIAARRRQLFSDTQPEKRDRCPMYG